MIKINLQLFAEGDSGGAVTAPSGDTGSVGTAQPQAGEGQVTQASGETSTPTEGQTEAQKQEAIMLKYKYNHQDIEEPFNPDVHGELIQKGKNYDKVYENFNKLQSDPRLSFVENLAKEYDMTPEQYIDAVRQEKEQARLNDLIQQNIPPELAQEIMENRKFRDTMTAKEQEFTKQEQDKKNYADFVQSFPDVKADTIPLEVWKAVESGESLVNAYMKHDYQQLKQKYAAKENNQANAENSPSPVTGNGGGQSAYYTKDQVLGMSRQEVETNLDKIKESQKYW